MVLRVRSLRIHGETSDLDRLGWGELALRGRLGHRAVKNVRE